MRRKIKYNILRIVYFPIHLAIAAIEMPFLAVWFAWEISDTRAFEDAYFTKDNPVVNQDGPTMQSKRKHCWLVRFLCFWL